MLYKVKLLRTLMLSSVMTMITLLTLMTFDPGGDDNVVAMDIVDSNVTQHTGVWLENSVTKVVMEPHQCGEEDIGVIIHSHGRNSQMRASQRNAMRQSGLGNIKPVFVVFRSDKDGELTIRSSTQTPHYLHRALARVLAPLPANPAPRHVPNEYVVDYTATLNATTRR